MLNNHDSGRLRSWAIEIAETILPQSRREDLGADWRLTGAGGLAICKRNGAWFLHSAGIGSFDPVRLIAQLKGCSRGEAMAWGAAWLQSHPGTGSCSGEEADDA